MKKHYILLLTIFILSNGLRAQWKQINGPFGGKISAIAINENDIFAGTYGGGIFLSSNNGSTWIAVNYGLPANTNILSLSINGSNIFAGTSNGVFLSANNGSSWTAVNTGLPANSIVGSFAINGSTIFSGTNNGVFLSTNSGTSWTAMNTGLPANTIVGSLAISGNNIFAGTNKGVFVSSVNGNSWSAANEGLPPYGNFSLVVSGNSIFAGTYDGVYLSEDNGNTWTGLNQDPVGFVFALAVNGSKIFAGVWVNGIYSNGVVCSNDNGSTWGAANTGLADTKVYSLAISGNNIFAGTNTGMFLSADNGNTWSSAGCRLPNDAGTLNMSGNTFFAGTHDGIYHSENNGNTWALTSYYYPDNPPHSVNALACNSNTIFAGTQGAGAFISTDQGNSWTAATMNISTIYSFVMTGNIILAGGLDGVALSTDNGNTWIMANTGLTGGLVVYSLAINGNKIFAGTDNGVFLSSNNCNTWTAVNTGLPPNANVYRITTGSNTIFAGTDTGVFLSTNNGGTWSAVNTGLPAGNSIHSLTTDGSTVFAGLDDGVFMTSNNGSAWTAANNGLSVNTNVTSLAVNSHSIYASIHNAGIWENTSLLCIPPAISITASADHVCAGEKVTLTAEGGASYVWTGGISNGVAFTPTETTTYTVTVIDTNNCSNTAVRKIIVNPLPKAVIQPGNTIAIYESDSIKLVASDSINCTYHWSTGATSQSIFVSKSGSYSVTITNAYGCSATSPATLVNVLLRPYVVTRVSQTCSSPDPFCIPINKWITDVQADSIIGYDIALHYNKNKVHPTGTITLSNALINPSYVSSAVYSNDSIVNVSLYLNGTAPANTYFKGTGDLLCINFTKDAGFTSADSAGFSGSIDESYATTVKSYALKEGAFSTYKDSLFYGKLVNWTNNVPIAYTPGVNLITNVYGTDSNCGNKTTTPVSTPDANGNFVYNILKGKSVEIERDIDNHTKVGVIHGGYLSGYDAQLGSYVATMNPVFQPTIYQMIALDVNTDGKISAGDLTQIIQRALWIIPEFIQSGKPKSKDWLFVSDSLLASGLRYTRSATYPKDDGVGFSKSNVPVVPSCLKLPVTNMDCPLILPATFKGIVLGDLDSSYQTLGPNPALNKITEVYAASTGTVVIDLSNAVWNGNSADIPVSIAPMVQAVHALDFKIQFSKNLTYNTVIKQAGYIEMLSNYYEDESAAGFTSYGGNQNYETGKTLVNVRLSTSSGSINASDFPSAIAFINGKPAQVKVINTLTDIISSGNDANKMDIYPTPLTSQATIRFSQEQKNILLRITDVMGKEIKNINFSGRQLTLEKGEMQAGVYFVQVINDNKNVATRKIVVQ